MTTALARTPRPSGYKSKAEARWAERLAVLARCGPGDPLAVLSWSYEPVTLRLGSDARYTPDFMVIRNDRVIEFQEVKGFMREAARVRIQVAARMYPMFRFVIAWAKDGGFTIEEVQP